jgi:hypothetical protein
MYDEIELSLEETVAAIEEGKRKKFFHLRSADYWKAEEQKAIDAHEEEKRLNRLKSSLSHTGKNLYTGPSA